METRSILPFNSHQRSPRKFFYLFTKIIQLRSCLTALYISIATGLLLSHIRIATSEEENLFIGITTKSPTQCEPQVLQPVIPDPFYDATEVTVHAATTFAEFLSSTPNININEMRTRAYTIAQLAIDDDENLLAVALAAPSIPIAVVQFRQHINVQPHSKHNKSYLNGYWRELGIAWNRSGENMYWGAPFRDCGPLKGRWLWPFSVSVFKYDYKTVASSFIAADIDQCNDYLEEIFGKKHSCDRETTFCLATETEELSRRGSYTCLCKESYYAPNQTLQGFLREDVENNGIENFTCVPCPGGCIHCDQYGVCLYVELQEVMPMENLLKGSIGAILSICVLCCFILSIIVFRQRKCKIFSSGMWTVLEMILLGIILLYGSVVLHFFQASMIRCLLEPWFRELGFTTCYGAIILKLYRHLVEFRTRKAHRWVLRDVDLLKYLGTMIFAVICYMSAFTAFSIDLIENTSLEGLQQTSTNTCHPLKWEYVTQSSEILILCFGINLAITTRNANTPYRERQFLVASITMELIVSIHFYVLRILYLQELSPGAIMLALFIRSQLTNTMTMGLIFLPKLWYHYKKCSNDSAPHLGRGYAGLSLGDPDIGELTISEMNAEEIRAELKRLYTQLEILKNKTLRQENPHISKRRGGRKAGHRRFSLQALSSKHKSNKHNHDVEVTEAEPSRTPEDSVCSADAPIETLGEVAGVSISK